MINILILIIISCIANVFVNQIVPLEYIKDKIGIGHYGRKLRSNYFFIDMIIFSIWKVINCPGCAAFWITLLYFQSIEGIWLGFVSYVISTIIYLEINKISL